MIARLDLAAEIWDSAVDEPSPQPGQRAADYVGAVGQLKAAATLASIQATRPDLLARGVDVLASDTAVETGPSVGREILGKPKDADDARRMLTALAAERHAVASSVCWLNEAGTTTTSVDTTYVTFRPLEGAEIEAYVQSGEAFGKAGAYAIQENAHGFVATMEGRFTTVVGLPLPLVAADLLERGFPLDPTTETDPRQVI